MDFAQNVTFGSKIFKALCVTNIVQFKSTHKLALFYES